MSGDLLDLAIATAGRRLWSTLHHAGRERRASRDPLPRAQSAVGCYLPVAANQASFPAGAVTNTIGAMQGRGSFTRASIFALPALLALKLPVLTLTTVAVF